MSIFLTVWRIFWPDLMTFTQNTKFEDPIFKGVTPLYRAQVDDIVGSNGRILDQNIVEA